MITIYTTPTCGFCRMTKEYLKSKGVSFEEKDITQDQQAQEEMVDMTGQMGVPVTNIDGTFIVGFDRNKIDLVLRQQA